MAQSALMRMGRPPSIQSSRSPTQSVRAPGGGGLAVWRQDSTGAIAACTLLLARFRRRKAGSVDWPALGSELSFQTLLPPPPRDTRARRRGARSAPGEVAVCSCSSEAGTRPTGTGANAAAEATNASPTAAVTTEPPP